MVPPKAWSSPRVTATESCKLNCELKEEPTKPPVNLAFFKLTFKSDLATVFIEQINIIEESNCRIIPSYCIFNTEIQQLLTQRVLTIPFENI
jgi:hypothetical protein